MFKYSPLIFIIILLSCHQTPTLDIESGVSKALATYRKAHLSDISYDLSFDIPKLKDDAINGHINISFQLNAIDDHLQIDFKEENDHLISIAVNNEDIEIDYRNEHIIINKQFLNTGENVISIKFIAGDQSLNRNEDFLYTLLVPDRARTVFPLFDQPNLKAKYTLSLTIPSHWKAQANGPLTTREDLKEGSSHLIFGETKPISSYLFAFTAGAYQEATSEDGMMTMLYRETDAAKVKKNISEIFQLHKASLDWLEDYTQIDYPFQKFDFALIPSFQYGGMEHVGAIFYNERSLMLDKEASINQQLSRGSLIAHETAHMWFGDLVTMDWFDDVWLKEVFANFMAAKIVNPSFPEVDHDLRFLLAHYPRAYAIDRSQGSHPIQQKLLNLNNAGTLYGAIIYQKAPIVMRNLERLIGEEKFREGLQEYLNAYSFDNATWDDLIAIMQKRTSANLEQWNKDWVKSSNMPTIEITTETAGANADYAYTTVDNSHVWPQQVDMMTNVNGTIQIENLNLESKTTTLHQTNNIDVKSYNYKGEGYGYFKQPNDELPSLLTQVNQFDNAQERAGAWIAMWEELLNGRIESKAYLSQLYIAIDKEDNPLLTNYLYGHLSTIFWNFLDDDERSSVAIPLENQLWDRLSNETNKSIKRGLYQTYVAIATSTKGSENLIRLWKGETNEVDLFLSSRDKEQLTYAIGIREIEGHEEIYEQQINLMTNPDDVKRMEFVKPAISAAKATRDIFFESLKSADNRSQERWVLTALSNLHHPLRQSTSRDYVLPSLKLIEEIQVTGDIFFPKRWLDNTLGSYGDPETRAIVNTYLEEHPELSTNLRNKIYQAGDLLLK